MKILLLEDDYLYKVSIKEFLQELDFIVDDFENVMSKDEFYLISDESELDNLMTALP